MKCIQHVALRGAFVLALGLVVAACNSNDVKAPPPPGGGGTIVRQEDQFGGGFGVAFRADNNSEPSSPTDGDIGPISLTTEPFEIK